ncbi:MAG: hypothetical protein JO051_05555, partial [Acidobacteriaceae bacterium]|nr:hypothetical protein [Acidobacteriaceae bacterium]
MFQLLKYLAAPAGISLLFTFTSVPAKADSGLNTFKMVVSAGAAACLPNASATVTIRPAGAVEIMDVAVQGL